MGRLYEPVMIGLRGSKWGFAGAVSVILIWALTGPLSLFGHVAAHHQYGNNYRHFPMVFVIQNTQNRDARAISLKLNELI
jgi:low affinity Fe/Cu permease